MLDIKFIRENPDQVKQGLQAKGFDSGLIDQLLPLDEESRSILAEIESLRAERNKIAAMGPHAADQGRQIKQKLESLDQHYKEKSEQVKTILASLPNIPSADSPIGPDESANVVIRKEGEAPQLTNPKDHVELAEQYDLIDIQRAVKVAESRFNYLKNQAVLLEFALIRLALDIAQKHGFTPMITPQLVNEDTAAGTGYLSKSQDAEPPAGGSEVYKTQDNLYLIGTSEMALVAYHKDELLMEKDLPKRYVGFSTCFRREAGSYGKDTQGILRQHQFDKVELVSFVKPEDSDAELEKILGIEEEIMQTLQLPYQVVQIATGDLGFQAAKKFDIEAWMPGQNKYRETHSCSNTTDFQSRRLNIRYKTSEGKNEFVHTLNGTAVAIGRMIIAILENGQQEDGRIMIPKTLQPYTGFTTIG
jgi:seryl-tRNA synthetase